MKSFFVMLIIIAGLLLTLWGAGSYMVKKVELQQKEVDFALSEGHGETAEQKQVMLNLKKTLRNTAILLAAGGFLLFIVISHLNKPVNKVLKKTSNQL